MPSLTSYLYHRLAIHLVMFLLLWTIPHGASADTRARDSVESVSLDTSRIIIDFPINRHTVDPDFSSNRRSLDSLSALLDRIELSPALSLDAVVVTGTASPDGDLRSNLALAQRRMVSLRDYLVDNYNFEPDDITLGGSHVPWDEFRSMLADAGMPWSMRAIDICYEGADSSQAVAARRMARLRTMDSGGPWKVMARDIFPRLRRGALLQVTAALVIPAPPAADDTSDIPQAEPAPTPEPVVADLEPHSTPEPVAGCGRGWHLSSDVAGWASLVSNISGHYDFACRWSAALTLRYSALNYGTSTRKFRTFALRPEVRWWGREGHNGLFLDAHLQMISYNVALSHWRYRIQDADGRHPALGGGLGIGYRLPVGTSGRWALEAQAGVGVYHLQYSRYENRINGALVDTRTRTWAGIDNLSLSVVYNFNMSDR